MIDNEILNFGQLDRACSDRGLFFGDGVYEVIRSYDGCIFGLDEHIARFKSSLKAVEIEGVDVNVIRQRVEKAYAASGLKNAKIYFHITRGCGPRDHAATGLTPRFFLTVEKTDDCIEIKEKGIKVITVPDTRWARCDIKTLNLLPNVLAKKQAAKAGADEAIFVNEAGFITEGASSAFFAVFDDKLQTSPLSANILPSITRKFILQAAENLPLEVLEKSVRACEAKNADEMFIAVSSMDIVPVVKLDGSKIGFGKVGKITKLLITAFADIIKSKSASPISRVVE